MGFLYHLYLFPDYDTLCSLQFLLFIRYLYPLFCYHLLSWYYMTEEVAFKYIMPKHHSSLEMESITCNLMMKFLHQTLCAAALYHITNSAFMVRSNFYLLLCTSQNYSTSWSEDIAWHWLLTTCTFYMDIVGNHIFDDLWKIGLTICKLVISCWSDQRENPQAAQF